MAACFGLYFGSSNVSIAMHKEGNNDVLTNDAGDRVTPAMVAFINGEKCVGLSAKQNKVRFASSTISHIKEAIRNPQAAQERHKQFKVHSEGEVRYEIIDGEDAQCYTMASLVSSIFYHMHNIAKRCCQESDSSFPSVLAVPSSFSQDQKELIRNCASEAGFEVLRVISEPSAAALSYNLGQENNRGHSNLVIYRIGGCSMDVTILKVSCGIYRILSQITVPDLGGDTFTQCLVEHCIQEFQRQFKVNLKINQRALGKLHNAADICKHSLTLNSTAQCCAESLYDGIDLSLNVSRARFESLVSGVLQQCLEPIGQALKDAGLQKQDIHNVVLCGGSAKISRLQQLLREYFENAQVLAHIPPDEVIALGAAAQAAILASKDRHDVIDIDTLQNTLYIKALQEDKTVLIPVLLAGSPVPTRWQQSVKLSTGQTSFVLEVVQEDKDETSTDKTISLAKLVMTDLPEDSCISLSIQAKSDGSIYICGCSESNSEKAESVVIEAS